ncbi:MAG: FecR domain-containing protein [Phycisphaeraceae bacterium]|nr:FecR domain-containing protein [Phycisphaeraceae bacterium]
MPDTPSPSRQVDDLIGAVLEGEFTPSQLEELNRLLATDSSVVERWVELSELHVVAQCLLGRSGLLAGAEPGVAPLGNDQAVVSPIDGEGLMQQLVEQAIETRRFAEMADQSALALSELARLEDQAEGMLVTMHGTSDTTSWGTEEVTAQNWQDALVYLLHQTFTSKRVVGLAAAAALLLGVIIAVALKDGPEPEREFVERPGQVETFIPDAPIMTSAVATLTAEHDAVWDRRPNEDLFAGQRFTLEKGFAEITTRRGAVAILEAPATIELIDSPNALRLHTGKLVGICETESSKGFLVRTPHMDITDLGTRFGVDATQSEATAVHVLEGEVDVVGMSASDERAAEPQRLEAGQALRADPIDGVTSVGFEKLSFVQDVEQLSYRPAFQGHDILWRGQASGDLSLDARQADAMQVFIERTGVRLQRDTTVDLADGRVWSKGSVPGQQSVSAGTRVDVYLLHTDPAASEGVSGGYTIRFGRPILGVIAHQDTLAATDATLGAAGTTYPSYKSYTGKRRSVGNEFVDAQRGLDIGLGEKAFFVEDNTALQLVSNAVGLSDQVRVLVQAMEEQD